MSSVVQWRASSRALGHEARQARNEQILDLWKAGGLTAEDIGARFNVAPSTVVFALRSARKRRDPRAVSRSDSIWTPELTERAAQMRRDGYSSSRIAAALGQGITRNAVVGRLARVGETPIVVTKIKIRTPKVLKWTPEHDQKIRDGMADSVVAKELGVSVHDVGARRRKLGIKIGRTLARGTASYLTPIEIAEPAPELIAIPVSVTIHELRPFMCRYMLGDATEGVYCGSPANGGSWCPGHRALVYQPTPPRKVYIPASILPPAAEREVVRERSVA